MNRDFLRLPQGRLRTQGDIKARTFCAEALVPLLQELTVCAGVADVDDQEAPGEAGELWAAMIVDGGWQGGVR